MTATNGEPFARLSAEPAPSAHRHATGSGGRRTRSTMGLEKTAAASNVALGKVAAVQA
jgi:hypothetical protein